MHTRVEVSAVRERVDLVCSDSHSGVVGRPGEAGDSVAAGQSVRLQHLQLSRQCKAVEGTALQ